MKFLHISDLHLGKKLGETDLSADQRYILLNELIGRIISSEKPDAIIIAGDIYNRSAPSGEAIKLFDEFLTELSRHGISVFMISGNHDSSEKVSYGARIMQNNNIFISEEFDGTAKRVACSDEYGELYVYLLPFIRIGQVKQFYPEAEISSYTDAVKLVLENSGLDVEKRSVVVSHQFITGDGGQTPVQCESETVAVGGLENASYTAFDGFDYAALGHIHGAQLVGRKTVRYCGTLLKYSASEVNQEKSVTVVELREKGNVEIRTIPVKPLRDMRVIKGKLEEILMSQNDVDENDLVYIELTDKETLIDAMRRLRVQFPNIIQLSFSGEISSTAGINAAVNPESKSPAELFSDFYEMRRGEKLSDKKLSAVTELFEQIGGDSI